MVETEIIISLNDARSKYISEVLGNKSCKRILGYLSENEATVSDLSRELKIPINTADYNIKKLIKAGLIEKANYWWSVKGKKMPTYKISNKKIVISPKSFKSYSKYLFALAASGAAALIIRNMEFGKSVIGTPIETLKESGQFARDSSEAILSGAQKVAEESTTWATEGSSDIIVIGSNLASNIYTGIDVWLWFLLGAWSMIFIFFIFHLFIEGNPFKHSREKSSERINKKKIKEYVIEKRPIKESAKTKVENPIAKKIKETTSDSETKNIRKNSLKGGSKK